MESDSLNTRTVNSIQELIDVVKNHKNNQNSGDPLWFRGVCNEKYELIPHIIRINKLSNEKQVFDLFTSWSHKNSVLKSDWELLIEMDTYFIPTRLLDWTEHLGIALFYAVKQHYQGLVNPAIYILNPLVLNLASNLYDIPEFPNNSHSLSYEYNYLQLSFPFPQCPIGFRSNFKNERVIAHHACFTVHGKSTAPLEILCPNSVLKVIISKTAIPSIEDFLFAANIDILSIFPDAHGIANHIEEILK